MALLMSWNANICVASSSNTNGMPLQENARRESRSVVRTRSRSNSHDKRRDSNSRSRSPKQHYEVRPRRQTCAPKPNF